MSHSIQIQIIAALAVITLIGLAVWAYRAAQKAHVQGYDLGYDDAKFPKATYHAFWDETKGYPAPTDGRPVYSGLRPEFHWPAGA